MANNSKNRYQTDDAETLTQWRRAKGWNCREAASYLGLTMREYQTYEATGWTLGNVPLRPQPIYPF